MLLIRLIAQIKGRLSFDQGRQKEQTDSYQRHLKFSIRQIPARNGYADDSNLGYLGPVRGQANCHECQA